MIIEQEEQKTQAQKAKILHTNGLLQDNQLSDDQMIDKRWMLFTSKRQMTYDEVNSRER